MVIHQKVGKEEGREVGDRQGSQIIRVEVQVLMGHESRVNIHSYTS